MHIRKITESVAMLHLLHILVYLPCEVFIETELSLTLSVLLQSFLFVGIAGVRACMQLQYSRTSDSCALHIVLNYEVSCRFLQWL